MTRQEYEKKLSKLLNSGRILMAHGERKDPDGDQLHDAVLPTSVSTFELFGWKKVAGAPVTIKAKEEKPAEAPAAEEETPKKRTPRAKK